LGALERQLDALLERRRVVPLHQAIAALGSREAAALAAITFDDGYEDYGELAVPALARRGLHATLFVPAGHLGATNRWDAGRREERHLLDASSLQALDRATTEIGVHGYTHRRLSGLTSGELDHETREAADVIEDACGYRPSLFCYPYGIAGDLDEAAERAVAAAGFEAACSSIFGRGSAHSERYRLRRVTMEPGDSRETAEMKLDGAYDWLAWKESLGAGLRRWGLRR